MQKIILNEKTVGAIMDRLNKFTNKRFSINHCWDKTPSKKNKFKVKEYKESYYREAKVTKHWNSHIKSDSTPLIHIDYLDGMHFDYYKKGDVFYFFGGNKIYVARYNDSLAITLGKNHLSHTFERSLIGDHELTDIESDRALELSMYEELDMFDYDDIEII